MNYFFFFLSGAWVNAEAATDFCVFVDFGSLRILDALDATLFDVFSFLAIIFLSQFVNVFPYPNSCKLLAQLDLFRSRHPNPNWFSFLILPWVPFN